MYVWEPIGSTPDVITCLALLSLTSANASELGERGRKAREKGLSWLSSATADVSLQGSCLKLILGCRLGQPAAERESLLKQIVSLQRPEGGWGQSPDMQSDAYATGLVLYSLAEARFPLDDPAIAKARAFLANSQEPGGSWAMTSRPGGPGGKSAKNLQPIAYSGTAWAVMGLMRSTPSAPPRADSAGQAAE